MKEKRNATDGQTMLVGEYLSVSRPSVVVLATSSFLIKFLKSVNAPHALLSKPW
jgi:hypothetical protein